MNWLIIILVLALAIGPVLYLLPNAKDKRLTALREQARRLGLSVKITSLPKLDPSASERVSAGGKRLDPRVMCASYELPMAQSVREVEPLLFLRLPLEPTVPVREVFDGWALHGDSSAEFWARYSSDQRSLGVLHECIDRLPRDTLGVAVDERFVSCYWQEKSAAESNVVAQIQAGLAMLRDQLCGRFGAA